MAQKGKPGPSPKGAAPGSNPKSGAPSPKKGNNAAVKGSATRRTGAPRGK